MTIAQVEIFTSGVFIGMLIAYLLLQLKIKSVNRKTKANYNGTMPTDQW